MENTIKKTMRKGLIALLASAMLSTTSYSLQKPDRENVQKLSNYAKDSGLEMTLNSDKVYISRVLDESTICNFEDSNAFVLMFKDKLIFYDYSKDGKVDRVVIAKSGFALPLEDQLMHTRSYNNTPKEFRDLSVVAYAEKPVEGGFFNLGETLLTKDLPKNLKVELQENYSKILAYLSSKMLYKKQGEK